MPSPGGPSGLPPGSPGWGSPTSSQETEMEARALATAAARAAAASAAATAATAAAAAAAAATTDDEVASMAPAGSASMAPVWNPAAATSAATSSTMPGWQPAGTASRARSWQPTMATSAATTSVAPAWQPAAAVEAAAAAVATAAAAANAAAAAAREVAAAEMPRPNSAPTTKRAPAASPQSASTATAVKAAAAQAKAATAAAKATAAADAEATASAEAAAASAATSIARESGLARQECLYLRNELSGFTSQASLLSSWASTLAIVLALLVALQFTAVRQPPGGFDALTRCTPANSNSPSCTSHTTRSTVLTFFFLNSFALIFSLVGLCLVALHGLFPSDRISVQKAVDTFCAYIDTASPTNLGKSDNGEFAKAYKLAICHTIISTLESRGWDGWEGQFETWWNSLFGNVNGVRCSTDPDSEWGQLIAIFPSPPQFGRLRGGDRWILDMYLPSRIDIPSSPQVVDHFQLFSGVLTFSRLCLDGELVWRNRVVKWGSALLALSLLCTLAAYFAGAMVTLQVMTGTRSEQRTWFYAIVGSAGVLFLITIFTVMSRVKRVDFAREAEAHERPGTLNRFWEPKTEDTNGDISWYGGLPANFNRGMRFPNRADSTPDHDQRGKNY